MRLVKRAEVLIGGGHFSKASRLLRSTEECLPVTQELADKMQMKFPKRRETRPGRHERSSHLLHLNLNYTFQK